MFFSAAFGALSAIPLAVWTWRLNERSGDLLSLLILIFDFWFAFLVVTLPIVVLIDAAAALGGRSPSTAKNSAAVVALLFFALWFVRMEPAHQFVSFQPHMSVAGLIDLAFIVIVTLLLLTAGLRWRGVRRLVVVVSIVLVASLTLEALARFQAPARRRDDTAARVVPEGPLVTGDGATPRRVLFIGVDGMEWRLVSHLIRAGKLPATERLLRSSRYYQLDNLKMRLSPEIWTSMYTGIRGGENGVDSFLHWEFLGVRDPVVELPKFGFHSVFFIDRLFWHLRSLTLWSVRPVSNKDFSAPPLWAILSNEGRRTIVIDALPIDAAPEDVNGAFAISQTDRLRVFTPSAQTDVLFVGPTSGSPVAAAMQIERRKSEAAARLFREGHYDVAIYYTHFLDTIEHLGWEDAFEHCPLCGDPAGWTAEKVAATSIGAAYIETDRTIDTLMKSFAGPVTVILASDHGWDYSDYKHFESPFGILAISTGHQSGYGGVASVLTVAPTVLSLAGVRPDVVMREPLALGQPSLSRASYASIRRRYVTPPGEEMIRQLRALGYIAR